MSKRQNSNKESKKKRVLTPKEKKVAKREKKESSGLFARQVPDFSKWSFFGGG